MQPQVPSKALRLRKDEELFHHTDKPIKSISAR
jgi:hypothetical protein